MKPLIGEVRSGETHRMLAPVDDKDDTPEPEPRIRLVDCSALYTDRELQIGQHVQGTLRGTVTEVTVRRAKGGNPQLLRIAIVEVLDLELSPRRHA